VKKMKLDVRDRGRTMEDLYASHQPNRAPTPPPNPVRTAFCHSENPLDPSTAMAGNIKRNDPYEFDDDMNPNMVSCIWN